MEEREFDMSCLRRAALSFARAKEKELKEKGVPVTRKMYSRLVAEGYRRAKENPSCQVTIEQAKEAERLLEEMLQKEGES